ncbi:hypothetical protein LXL04_033643 [Taraxacum kok-saghyz]
MGDAKLLRSVTSPIALRIVWALKLKGIEYDTIYEDLVNKSCLLLEYNPIHKKVPLLCALDYPSTHYTQASCRKTFRVVDEEILAPPPPESLLPQGSTSLATSADTPFSTISIDGSTNKIQSLEIEVGEGSYVGMPFVMFMNNGSDFYIEFSAPKKAIKDAGDGKGTSKSLLDKIAGLESEAHKSFMHRFNIAADLMGEATDTGELGLAGILVWMRCMATRQLIWNKNYNVKPRMIMSTVGRGGEGDVGQRIRDEILVIQVLVVIDMKAGKCYYLDSLKHSTINQQLKQIIDTEMLVYTTQSGSDKRINLMYRNNLETQSVAIYVCKFMKEIIDNGLDVLVNANVNLDGIREDWAHYVSNFFDIRNLRLGSFKSYVKFSDNGTPICESLVILEYIDETWSNTPRFLPEDPLARASARFWAKFCDEQEAKKKTLENLKVVEELLEGKKFFNGDTFGFLDLVFGWLACYPGVIKKATNFEVLDEETFPNIWSWKELFCDIPVIKENWLDENAIILKLQDRKSSKVV